MKKRLAESLNNDLNLIQEYGFYEMLKPQLQSELIELLFGNSIMKEFEPFFSRCERLFVNRMIISLVYRSFEHN